MLPDMSGLKFHPQDHRYILEQGSVNLQLPSVTQILQMISNEYYDGIDYTTLMQAADRGTRVHEAIELIDQCGWIQGDEDIKGYLDAYCRWIMDFRPEIVATEWRGYHRNLYYAGTVDKLIRLPQSEDVVLVDVKTSSIYYPLLVDMQLGGYAQMIESWQKIKIGSAYGLQLKADGSYEFHLAKELARSKTMFGMCFALHSAIKKDKEG